MTSTEELVLVPPHRDPSPGAAVATAAVADAVAVADAASEPPATSRVPGSLAWRLYLLLGLLGIVGFYLAPDGPWKDGTYVVIGLSGVLAIVAGVVLHGPTRRAPWLFMAFGQFMWVFGDAIQSWYQDIDHTAPFPSMADAFYLAAYPVLAWALLLLIRRRQSRRDIAGLLDSAIVTVGLGVLSWVLLAHPTMIESQQSVAASAVAVAYPVADILLVGLLVRLVTTPGGRTPAFRFLLGAVALLVLGDTVSALVNLVSSGSTTFDFIWLCSYVLWGAAALHPSMRTMSDPKPFDLSPFSRRRLFVLTVATLMAPSTLAAQLLFARRVDGWAIVAGSVVLFLLVVGRMNLAIDQIVATNRHRERLQADLAHQAMYDSLTQLPNRSRALELISGALHRAQRTGALVGLLFVDLDGFKQVNDTFGHAAGDEVLRLAARRMQEEVRAGDVVARLGGDEFVILLEPVDNQVAVAEIAQRVVDAVARPMATPGSDGEVTIGASIGAAFNLDSHVDAGRLLGEADAAAYRAKALGKGRVEVFDESLRRTLSERAGLEAAIVSGLRDAEFVLYYQPVIDVRTSTVQGFEALLRWNRPGFGLVAPDEFIPLAESSTLICRLGRWVLEEALGQLARWTEQYGCPDLWVAVNVSGRHVSDARIIADVEHALEVSGVDRTRLVLELTETIPIDDVRAMSHLDALRRTGIGISIDDFGTGYNSIIQMQHLPIDSIKIDRSFLSSTHRASHQLVVLIVEAAHAFGLQVIAEGVETTEQLRTLGEIGCDLAQGFLISAPVAPDAVHGLLTGRREVVFPLLAPS